MRYTLLFIPSDVQRAEEQKARGGASASHIPKLMSSKARWNLAIIAEIALNCGCTAPIVRVSKSGVSEASSSQSEQVRLNDISKLRETKTKMRKIIWISASVHCRDFT